MYKLVKLSNEINELFESVKIDINKNVIPIALIGEIYTLLEPKINHDIEKKLGCLGLEIHKSIFLSEWIKEHIFLDNIGYDFSKSYKKYSRKYLNREIGGHTCENLGKAVQFIKNKGCRGIIHLAPLTCMPEIVTKEILPQIAKDYSIPYMSLFIDEHTGEAGFNTRLEAFADLLSLPNSKRSFTFSTVK
jgi:predicted nucleotide-binding protein (sugar kinase/HSP70/actin superfamily)